MCRRRPRRRFHNAPQAAVDAAVKILNANYNYLTDWAEKNQHDEKAQGIIRLMFRMLGIYHGGPTKSPSPT